MGTETETEQEQEERIATLAGEKTTAPEAHYVAAPAEQGKAAQGGPVRKRSVDPVVIAECALAIALTAVAAQITVPIAIWKFTLQVLIVMVVALTFRPLPAAATYAGYILLGAVGLPVFSWAGSPGLARLMGPFGGFLYSYILAAALGSLVRRAVCPPERRLADKGRGILADVVALVVVALVIYGVETVHYIAIGMPSAPAAGIVGALMYTTIPYIPAEAFKGIAAFFIARALRRALPRFAER